MDLASSFPHVQNDLRCVEWDVNITQPVSLTFPQKQAIRGTPLGAHWRLDNIMRHVSVGIHRQLRNIAQSNVIENDC